MQQTIRVAIKFPIIPHGIAGAKYSGSIVPEELDTDGEKQITLRCNRCGLVMGRINAAIAEALVMKLLDEVVSSRGCRGPAGVLCSCVPPDPDRLVV